jgi:hypothetical protein
MHQAGVETAVIDHVTGHTTPGETARYTKGSRLSQLQKPSTALTSDSTSLILRRREKD